jgi:protein gp37
MNRSPIEWLRGPDGKEGFTWNPIRMRCTPISAGCANCWHLRFAKRHAANPTFRQGVQDAYRGGVPYYDNDEIWAPHKLRKPSRIAVQLMGDLFHHNVPPDFIYHVLAAISEAKQHTFMILTKRPRRMKYHIKNSPDNLWIGVSVENDRCTDRILELMKIPGAHRFLSMEPLLGPVHIGQYLCEPDGKGIELVIVGAETGPRKRPMEDRWVNDIRDECKDFGVSFFGKVDGQGNPIMPREMP